MTSAGQTCGGAVHSVGGRRALPHFWAARATGGVWGADAVGGNVWGEQCAGTGVSDAAGVADAAGEYLTNTSEITVFKGVKLFHAAKQQHILEFAFCQRTAFRVLDLHVELHGSSHELIYETAKVYIYVVVMFRHLCSAYEIANLLYALSCVHGLCSSHVKYSVPGSPHLIGSAVQRLFRIQVFIDPCFEVIWTMLFLVCYEPRELIYCRVDQHKNGHRMARVGARQS